MNKKIIWGVIIAVIALGGLLLYKYTGIFGPIIQLYSKNSSETSDWKTYTNNELGYSIKYPANYKITDNNVLISNKFVSAISLQISDPVNKAIEFNPFLTVDIIKQPYIVNGKIFISAKEYANSRYKNLQNLSIVEKVKGDPSIVEVSGMTQSEMSSELLQLKMLVGINNGLIYEVSYYPVDYKHFYEIADTFKFTSPKNTTIQPSITVLSPNGGESFVRNVEIPVSWLQNSNFAVNICILSKSGGCVYTSASINAISGQNKFVIPSDAYKFICASSCYLDSGYRIKITTDSPPGTPGEFLSDSSDTYFTITNYIAN